MCCRDVGHNNLHGTIPALDPRNLQTLYLNDNKFTGGLENIANLTHLIELYVWYCGAIRERLVLTIAVYNQIGIFRTID
jgi:hypothetical protein